MAALTTQTMVYPATTITTQAAAAGGDTLKPGDNVRLMVRNGGGSSINVTINRYPATDPEGVAETALVVAVANGAEKWIGPLGGSRFANPANGNVEITYSAVTSVTVAAIAT
jgi:hypothetical protein